MGFTDASEASGLHGQSAAVPDAYAKFTADGRAVRMWSSTPIEGRDAVPLYCDPVAARQDFRRTVLQARTVWLETEREHGCLPADGSDVVTPFDQFLY